MPTHQPIHQETSDEKWKALLNAIILSQLSLSRRVKATYEKCMLTMHSKLENRLEQLESKVALAVSNTDMIISMLLKLNIDTDSLKSSKLSSMGVDGGRKECNRGKREVREEGRSTGSEDQTAVPVYRNSKHQKEENPVFRSETTAVRNGIVDARRKDTVAKFSSHSSEIVLVDPPGKVFIQGSSSPSVKTIQGSSSPSTHTIRGRGLTLDEENYYKAPASVGSGSTSSPPESSRGGNERRPAPFAPESSRGGHQRRPAPFAHTDANSDSDDEDTRGGQRGAGARLRAAASQCLTLHYMFGISKPDLFANHPGSRTIHPASPFMAGKPPALLPQPTPVWTGADIVARPPAHQRQAPAPHSR
jgi:hypothetical protein